MSTPNLKAEERELIRLVNFFKRKVKTLVQEKKTTEDYTEIIATCDKLVEQISIHAKSRDIILEEREKLKGLIKEQAVCPKCAKNANLKFIGIEKSPEGWKSNKYRCKKCNIEFVWNAPNNPWDMVPYVERYIADLEVKLQQDPDSYRDDEQTREENKLAVEQLKGNLAKLKPVIEASDLDLKEMEARDKEMTEIVKNFTKHLQIEKIKMDLD